MTWYDIIKRGRGLSNLSKKLIDEVMLEVDEPLNIRAIMNLIHEKLEKEQSTSIETKHKNKGKYLFPTTRELQFYLSRKYQRGAFDIFTGKQLNYATKNYEMKYWK